MSKMLKEMLLLGAGASVEAGIPAAFKMTNRILELFAQESQSGIMPGFSGSVGTKEASTSYKILTFVVGGLLFDKGIKGENPLVSGVNVEELFNAVDLLSQRNRLEASPFIGSWHSMVDEFDKILPATPQAGKLHDIIFDSVMKRVAEALSASPPSFGAREIDKKIKEVIHKGIQDAVKKGSCSTSSLLDGVGREIESYLKDFIRKWTDKLKSGHVSNGDFAREFKKAIDQQPKPANGAIFSRVTESMIHKLVNLVWIQRESPIAKIQHLAPILNLVEKQQGLVVATLNYDNSVEFLARKANVHCCVATGAPGTEPAKERGISLLKLHGSIDWELHQPKSSPGRMLTFIQAGLMKMPVKSVEQINPEEKIKEGYRPAVIFGQRNKLTAEGPFLDILRSFRDELQDATILTVIGYSFADAHVNEYISRWLNEDDEHVIQIVDPNFENNSNIYSVELKRLRVSWPNRVRVLEKTAGAALIELYGACSIQESIN